MLTSGGKLILYNTILIEVIIFNSFARGNYQSNVHIFINSLPTNQYK